MDVHRTAIANAPLHRNCSYTGREASASPAVGALARHKREQARLVADAFRFNPDDVAMRSGDCVASLVDRMLASPSLS